MPINKWPPFFDRALLYWTEEIDRTWESGDRKKAARLLAHRMAYAESFNDPYTKSGVLFNRVGIEWRPDVLLAIYNDRHFGRVTVSAPVKKADVPEEKYESYVWAMQKAVLHRIGVLRAKACVEKYPWIADVIDTESLEEEWKDE